MPQAAALNDLTAEARQVRLFTLVRRCCQAIAAHQPLLIVLEGLQWGDQATLALLDDVSAHLENEAIFLAFTFRTRDAMQLATLERPSCIPIPLVDLSPASARQMLAQLVGTDELPQAVEQHLGMRDREGRDSPVNPLFLEEALNVMIGAGVLRVNGRVQVDETELARMQVPDTIHGLLLARLDRLPPAGRDLLQVASVIGRQFSAEPLQVIAEAPKQQTVLKLLTELSESEMTRLITADPEWTYLFQHAMTHEVAYESLPYARRQQLHAAVARWLAAKYKHNLKPLHSVLAYHYSRADNHAKAVQYAILAADEARNIFANREAIDLYTLAETHLAALNDEKLWETAVHLYLSRGAVFILLGEQSLAFEDAEKALDLANLHEANEEKIVAYNLMAETRYLQRAFEDVISLVSKITALATKKTSPDQLAKAHIWAGWAESSQLNYVAGLNHLNLAEKICKEQKNNYLLARVYEAVGYARYLQKELTLSLEAMQQSVELSREFSTPINIGIALSNIGFVQFTLGLYEEAVFTLSEAVRIGRDSGRNLLVSALINRAASLSRTGRFAEAEQDFEEANSLLAVMNYPGLQVETLLFWAFEHSSVLQKWEKARSQYEEVKEYIELKPESYIEEQARLYIGLGQVELNLHQLNEAESFLVMAESIILEKDLIWWRPIAEYLLGCVYKQQEDFAKAVEYFEKSLQASQIGCPDFRAVTLLELAILQKSSQKKEQLLYESIQYAKIRARYLEKLYCLEQGGRLLLLSEDPEMQDLGREVQNEAKILEERFYKKA